MRIAVAQLGARMHYAVPRIFHEAGLLERLFTDSYAGNKPLLEAGLRRVPLWFRHRSLEQWLGRTDRVLPPEKVTSFEWLGISYKRRLARASDTAAMSRVFAWAGREFGSRVVRAGFGGADTVWGFNGASLAIFTAAKRSGLSCILEQTVAPLQVQGRLVRAEMERWSGWQPGLEIPDEASENERPQTAEWHLADFIVCGSQFVVDGIAECGGPVEKCRIVPYGVDLTAFAEKLPRQRPPDDRLRVLFAGEVGLRKGAPWLLEALRTLGPSRVEARLAGRIALSRDNLAAYAEFATFLGAVPRSRMAELFNWADLFVLPSICEGSATVVYEAVASGVPVICTPNTGALESPAVKIARLDDITSLAEAIASYLQNDATPTIPLDVRWQYGLDAYAQRLLSAIRELERRHRASTTA